MNIRTKVLVWLAALFVVLGVVELSIQQRVLMPSFAELERNEARTAMRRIGYAMDLSLDRLEINATDWGNWADTYHFVHTRDPLFVSSNMTAVALRQLNLNTMLITDETGSVVMRSARNLESGRPIDLDLAKLDSLPADFPWRRQISEGKSAKGLLSTNLGILMLAASPVLDGNGGGPARGTVIVGRLLNEAEVLALGAQAQVEVQMADLRGDARVGKSAGQPEALVETDSVTQVYRSFDDIYGKPLMSLRVEIPRRITERGRAAVAYASVYLTVAAVGVLLILMMILNRLVLSPLARVTRHAVAVGEGSDPTQRLNFRGDDEIGRLAQEFDRMVERLADTRRELVDRSFQAGFAELARGVLHNLGNAMTPLGVKLSALHDRLRHVPVADMQRATDELATHAGDADRRADLLEFLRLGTRELAGTVEQSQADVAVMQRQTAIMQAALSEQMKSSRTEQVVEAVRLPDLVSQSLEIVPDTCRQRLTVDADESLRRVGVVRVARTVLRLILQNFIINAADAVRDAGRERGKLRVAAEIVTEADGDQLHLYCEDNGAGIAPDNLQRVFEKGYSTKSRDTNHGIGLHWCANAIAALGGRIWASSEGVGSGASMHVMLPLTQAGISRD